MSPAETKAVSEQTFTRLPIGSEFIYLGVRMRVVSHKYYFPSYAVPSPFGNISMPESSPALECEYVDAHGEILRHRFEFRQLPSLPECVT